MCSYPMDTGGLQSGAGLGASPQVGSVLRTALSPPLPLPSQVSVTAREDVPSFGPPLPSPPVFQKVRQD